MPSCYPTADPDELDAQAFELEGKACALHAQAARLRARTRAVDTVTVYSTADARS